MRALTRRAFTLLAATVPFTAAQGAATKLPDPLARFQTALIGIGKKKDVVTVLYLGDSHVAGDYLSGVLRAGLQARYGNAGRGLIQVPAYKYFRVDGAKIALEGEWQLLNSRTDQSSNTYGLAGVAVRSVKSGNILTASSPGAQQVKVHVLRQPSGGTASITIGANTKDFATDGAAAEIEMMGPGDTVSVRSSGEAPVTVLGVEFIGASRGARVVSLGVPSATAQIVNHWDLSLVKKQMDEISPSLVIFAFGVNEAFSESVDIEAWKADARKNIIMLRNFTKNASWVIVGPSDAQRDHGAGDACTAPWVIPRNLEVVRAHLSAIASDIGALFWDWQKEMGGPCSMLKWIEAGDGRNDHVHFTEAGYTKLGNMLLNAILPKA